MFLNNDMLWRSTIINIFFLTFATNDHFYNNLVKFVGKKSSNIYPIWWLQMGNGWGSTNMLVFETPRSASGQPLISFYDSENF